RSRHGKGLDPRGYSVRLFSGWIVLFCLEHLTHLVRSTMRKNLSGMPAVYCLLALLFLMGALLMPMRSSHAKGGLASLTRTNADELQPNSLCATSEKIIFSCPVKRPAKIVSLCASKDLTSDRGYLQYRFGLPGKVELEFPKDRTATQQKFQYSHYFRAQV